MVYSNHIPSIPVKGPKAIPYAMACITVKLNKCMEKRNLNWQTNKHIVVSLKKLNAFICRQRESCKFSLYYHFDSWCIAVGVYRGADSQRSSSGLGLKVNLLFVWNILIEPMVSNCMDFTNGLSLIFG